MNQIVLISMEFAALKEELNINIKNVLKLNYHFMFVIVVKNGYTFVKYYYRISWTDKTNLSVLWESR